MMPRVKSIGSRHVWTGKACPHCGYELIQVITTGFQFCSNHEMICDYEVEAE